MKLNLTDLIICFIWAAFGYILCLALKSMAKPVRPAAKLLPTNQGTRVMLPPSLVAHNRVRYKSEEFKSILTDLTLICRYRNPQAAMLAIDNNVAPRIERLKNDNARKIALAFKSSVVTKIVVRMNNSVEKEELAGKIFPFEVQLKSDEARRFANAHRAPHNVGQQLRLSKFRQQQLKEA